MKLNAVTAAMSAALLAGNVHAEDVAQEASASVPDVPTFTVSFPSHLLPSHPRWGAFNPTSSFIENH